MEPVARAARDSDLIVPLNPLRGERQHGFEPDLRTAYIDSVQPRACAGQGMAASRQHSLLCNAMHR